MPVHANVNTNIPWRIVVIAVCLLAIFFSTSIIGAEWWKLAIPAGVVGVIALIV